MFLLCITSWPRKVPVHRAVLKRFAPALARLFGDGVPTVKLRFGYIQVDRGEDLERMRWVLLWTSCFQTPFGIHESQECVAYTNVPDMNWMSHGRVQCLSLSHSSKASSEDSHAATWWYCDLRSMDWSIRKALFHFATLTSWENDNNTYQCTHRKNTEYITAHAISCIVACVNVLLHATDT